MNNFIHRYWREKPLTVIIILALIVRIIATLFAKGFGMTDDHFLVIESSQSWVNNYDYNNWLPSSGAESPTGHSFFYPGLHYIIFSFLDYFGFDHPQGKMYIIRFIHAVFSLLVVIFGYKITLHLSDYRIARKTGLLLALFWFMPFLAVRNMVEIVCIPFLMWGTLIILRSLSKQKNIWMFFVAGLILGIGFNIRFQTIIYTGGICLVLLIMKHWKQMIMTGLGYVVSLFLVQGMIDIFIWGYPFAELTEYINYNLHHASDYIITPWYTYILLLAGILIPPISIFLFIGFFRSWKKILIIFLPTFLFLLFHSYFPNKQERFILPVLPFFIIIGMIGWERFVDKSLFWKQRRKLLKTCWIFFWIINLLLLPVISTTFSKRALVESMTYLSQYPNKNIILLENTNQYGTPLVPRYYAKEWIRYINIDKSKPLSQLPESCIVIENNIPRFILFFEDDNLENRLKDVESLYPDLQYLTTIQPGFIDKVLHWLNPINQNKVIHIYKNTAIYHE